MSSIVRRLLAVLAAGALAAPGAAASNLLVNGSFESGPSVASLYLNLPGGSSSITGWTVGDFNVDYCKSTLWNAADGSYSVDLDGSAVGPYNGSIAQSFATTPGQPYVVSFALSGNPYNLPLLKQVEVSAGNAVQIFSHNIGAVAPPPVPTTLSYAQKTFLFTAVASTTTLRFRSLTPLSGMTGWGAVIDDVVVEPNTATWVDLGFALAGVAGPPKLAGAGTLVAGSPGSLSLGFAAPNAPALMFISLSATPTPFKCGTLVPVPAIATLALTTSPAGSLLLPWATWPAGLSGLALNYQCAMKDVAGPCGAALSNALRANLP